MKHPSPFLQSLPWLPTALLTQSQLYIVQNTLGLALVCLCSDTSYVLPAGLLLVTHTFRSLPSPDSLHPRPEPLLVLLLGMFTSPLCLPCKSQPNLVKPLCSALCEEQDCVTPFATSRRVNIYNHFSYSASHCSHQLNGHFHECPHPFMALSKAWPSARA